MDVQMPADAGLEVTREGDVLTIALNQPDRRNPQTPATWDALITIAESLPADLIAVLITGQGQSFSAGLDRRLFTPEGIPGQQSLVALAGLPAEKTDGAIAHWQRAFTVWREVRPLTIALVQGHAIGAGFQLALGADLMIVADDAELSLRETQLGLVPDLGGTAALLDCVGYRRALDLCLSGRVLSGPEAHAWGIATACTAAGDMRSHAEQLIGFVRSAPLGAALSVKRLLAASMDPAPQLAHERSAQIERLRILAGSMGAAGVA